MNFDELNAAFRMESQKKTVEGLELEFYPLTASQRIAVYQYAQKHSKDITHIQAMSICESCPDLSFDNLEQVKLWKPEILGEFSDFVSELSGVKTDAAEDAEKN